MTDDTHISPVAQLSRMTQDYLQAVWKCTEWSTEPVTVNDLSTKLEVTMSTVSSGIKRLVADGLLHHERYGGVELTATGRAAALQMVRRHRLLETYLVERLGYSWDEVHDEAEHLEHAVSDLFVERVAEDLGHPARDPHGDAIPAPDGSVTAPPATQLASLAAGECGTLSRISDEDPDLLRYLDEQRLRLDTHVRVLGRRDAAGLLSFESSTDGAAGVPHSLGLEAAGAIWVTADQH